MERRLIAVLIFVFGFILLVVCPTPPLEGARAESILQPWNKSRVRIRVPVSWEITRSDFTTDGIATETESYREVWTVEMGPGLQLYLVSPRAKIAVSGIRYRKRNGWLPTFLVMPEERFAQLLGFPGTYFPEQDDALAENLVFLKLSAPARSGESLTLHISKNEYFSVHLVLGR